MRKTSKLQSKLVFLVRRMARPEKQTDGQTDRRTDSWADSMITTIAIAGGACAWHTWGDSGLKTEDCRLEFQDWPGETFKEC